MDIGGHRRPEADRDWGRKGRGLIEPEVNSLAAVPACCREFEDPVDPRLLLESLLSKLFPFLNDLFIVPASSSSATKPATERP